MAELHDEAEKLFEAKFEFQKSDEWILPSVDVLFSEDTWHLEKLMSIKKDLNDTKAMLNDMGLEWHEHTNKIDKADEIRSSVKDYVEPMFFSNAWCKFIEIISTFPLLPCGNESSVTSFHLCEAPGGFIAALHYYLCLKFETKFKWKWCANTLNPYYEGHTVKEAVVDDRLLFPTLDKWYFGRDNTGDILNIKYHADLSDFLRKKFSVDLITADGGIDCMENPGEQESVVASLKLSEAVLALDNLNVGGCCVLKRFTLFESASVCTMYILNRAFDKVYIFKPVTSKSGNSEVYVICLRYVGKDKMAPYISKMRMYIEDPNRAIIPLCGIPATFIDQMEKCCKMFADRQMTSIKENISLYSHMSNDQQRQINEMQMLCVKLYFEKFSLKKLDIYDDRLCGARKFARICYGTLVRNMKSLYFKTTAASSYNEQQVKRNMVWEDRLHDIERRLNECFSDRKRKRETENSWFHVWKITQNVKNLHEGWIVKGKKFALIRNSKFCNPLILYLWNEISHAEQVKNLSHSGEPVYRWEWDSSQCLVAQSSALQRTEALIFMEPYDSEKNYLLQGLTPLCGNNVKAFLWKSSEETIVKLQDRCKTFVLDTTEWDRKSLHQEILIKSKLVDSLHSIIKCLNCGDCLIISIQSILTRFTAGVLFITLSLFSAVSPLLPEPTSPPSSGQLWILSDFQSPWWTENVLNYLMFILDREIGQNTVLEIVPMYELCAAQFFYVLLDQNNSSLIRRLESLITASKMKIRDGTETS